MKVKILKSNGWYKDYVGTEFEVNYYINKGNCPFRTVTSTRYIENSDCVITELPKSFCVKRCDDNNRDDWNKYLQWLNKQKNYPIPMFGGVNKYKYYGVNSENLHSDYLDLFGIEIHIDDMIKHIDYMESINTKYVDANGEPFVVGAWYKLLNSPTVEYRKCCKLPNDDSLVYLECITGISVGKYFSSGAYGCTSSLYRLRRVEDSEVEKYLPKEEFDLTTREGRIYHTEKHYPIGTKYIPLNSYGFPYKFIKEINMSPRYFGSCIEGGYGFIYANGKWAEIIKEEKTMETQKLSRQSLKEIHSIACSSWKETLEQLGRRNPLEDYIELSQDEINIMFDACTKDQLPIVSKYLKKDDESVDIMKFKCEIYDNDGRAVIEKRCDGEYAHKSLLLEDVYDWEIKKDSKGILCLIPTKKK